MEVYGCFFYLCQNISRKVQTSGLQERYQNDEDFSLSVQMIGELVFVPLANVVEAFESLSDSLSLELSALMDYFEDTYVGRPRRTRRAEPLFAHKIWNVN